MTSASLKPASTSPLWKYTRLAMFDGFVGFGSTLAVNRSSCSTGASSFIAVLDVDDVRQHLVLHVDQFQRLVGNRLRGRGDRGDGVTLVQRLAARHAVARQVAEVHRPFADERLFRGDVGEVLGGHHRLHAGQLQRLGRIDRHDAGMRMRRALHLAPQHAGHHHVGAELRAAGDLVHAVRTDRAGADNLQIGYHVVHRAGSPRISAAASMTARMILS